MGHTTLHRCAQNGEALPRGRTRGGQGLYESTLNHQISLAIPNCFHFITISKYFSWWVWCAVMLIWEHSKCLVEQSDCLVGFTYCIIGDYKQGQWLIFARSLQTKIFAKKLLHIGDMFCFHRTICQTSETGNVARQIKGWSEAKSGQIQLWKYSPRRPQWKQTEW